MTQPNQYGPAQHFDPAARLLAPARRASLLLLITGALALLCGICSAAAFKIVPLEQLAQQMAQSKAPIPDGMSAEDYARFEFVFMAVVGLFCGLIQIVLGVTIRKGGFVSSLFSTIYAGAWTAVLALGILGGVAGALANPMILLSLVMALVPTALFVLLLVWSIAAVRNSKLLTATRAQYQAQLWQYQQQSQGYGTPRGQVSPPQFPPQAPPSSYQDQQR